MERSGMSMNVIPTLDGTGEHGFIISHTVWDDGKCMEARVVLNGTAYLDVNLSGRPDNLLWMLDILEVASQLLKFKIDMPKPAAVREANDKYRDTTEKPFLS